VHSLAIYDAVSGVLRARPTNADQRREAFAAPLEIWKRVLAFEGCAVQFERTLQRAGVMREVPLALRRFLLDSTGASLRQSVIAQGQLAAICMLAERHGVRLLVLKGAARLIAGTLGGTRSIADIDLLASPDDAVRLHALMRSEHGYTVVGAAQPHHLAPLARRDAMAVEIHVRLAHEELPLDTAIWTDTVRIPVGGTSVEIPSATSRLLHTLEHATSLNWMSRYRLRDIMDVAACFTSDVSVSAVSAYVRSSPRRAALETILSAAHEVESRIPRRTVDAWKTIRRVSRARLAVAIPFGRSVVAERLFRYAGVFAEGSPAMFARAGMTAAKWVRAASVALMGM